MGIVRLVKPVKANMQQKMEEKNLIKMFSIVQSRQIALGKLFVKYAKPLFIIAINCDRFIREALLLYTFGLLFGIG